MTENVIINVETKYKDKGVAELKKVLAGTKLAMDNMTKSGNQNSDSFIKLQARTVALNTRIEQLKKSYTDVSKVSQTVNTHTANFKSKVSELSSSLPLLSIGLAGVAAGIIKFGVESFKMGADFQELRSNFVGSAQDLELFRKATAGTVTDGGLIQLSNYASDLGVSLKDQALLFSLAEDASDKYGGTVAENFERVVNATDGSAKGLRAIGIGVKEYNQELEKLLPNNVKNIDDLDAETQQQIRLEAIIKAKGITIEDVRNKEQSNADVIAELGKLYETLMVNIGLTLNENVKLGDSMEDLTGKTKVLGEGIGRFLLVIGDVYSFFDTTLNPARWLGYNSTLQMITDGVSDAVNKMKELLNLRDSARGGNFSGNQGADIEVTPTDQFGRPMYSPSSYIAEGGIKKPKISTSKGSNTNRSDTLSESEKKKLAEQEAILSINANGQAEFFELTKIKVPYTTDNKGLTNTDWMAGMSDKELQSFLALNNTPSNEPSTLVDDSQTIYNNIAGLMNILNVGTDTFVSKLLAGFGTAYQILDIATSILSFIPGFGSIFGKASGGMVNAGGTYIVGERGPEILRMSGSGGMVYNNSQTNKLMNTALNRQSPVNVYVSSNIDQRFLKVGIEKYNSNQKYIRA